MKRTELEKIFSLCAIHCTEEEKEELFSVMEQILHHMDVLKLVDTSGIDPCYHPISGIEMQNVFREDKPKNTLSKRTFLDQVPEEVGGMVKVPPIIS